MSLKSTGERVAFIPNTSFECAGVNWGIDQLTQLLKQHGQIYVPNKDGLVHNNTVLADLQRLGAVFVPSAAEIPSYQETGIHPVVANSMHGRSIGLTQSLMEKRALHYDLSCPLVEDPRERVQAFIEKSKEKGEEPVVFYVGKKKGHPEVDTFFEQFPRSIFVDREEVLAEFEPRAGQVYMMDSQTTINTMKAVEWARQYKDKFPGIKIAAGIDGCFATFNRQEAMRQLIIDKAVDDVLVFGSKSSSNTTELVKIARQEYGKPTIFVEHPKDLEAAQFSHIQRLGIHGGASAPKWMSQLAVEQFASWGFRIEEFTVDNEPVTFPKRRPKVYDYRDGLAVGRFLPLITTH